MKLRKFIRLCQDGHIDLAKKMHGEQQIDNELYGQAFIQACEYGRLEIVKWLVECYCVDYHDIRSGSVYSCQNGHLDVARWLYESFNFSVDYPFWVTCKNGHLNVAKWLYGSGRIVNINDAFSFSCGDGQLVLAKWLYGLNNVDIHFKSDYAFKCSCMRKHLDVAKWLVSLGKFDDHIINQLQSNYDKEIIRLLWKLGYKPTGRKMIKKFMETRIGYFKFLIRLCGTLMIRYHKVCDIRYKPNGVGYFEALTHFHEQGL